MMKLIIVLLAAVCILSCKNNPVNYAGTAHKMTERNFSITPNNSYSDLFVDSLQVEQFITQQSLSDTIANDMRSFYNSRNYQFAWFASDGLTEQALAFNSLYDYIEDISRKALDTKLDALMEDDELKPTAANKDIIKTELSLTWRFINYCWQHYADADTRAAVMEESVPSIKKPVIEAVKTSLGQKSDIAHNALFGSLKQQLKIYADSITAMPDSLAAQRSSMMKTMQQLLINLERMRWMPADPEGKLILVNIPEFRLHVMNGSKKEFDMDVVVGKQGHNTVMFSGRLNQVVFSPYWNVPPSIVRKELLPSIEKNPDYLQEKNMEVTGEENGLPVVRQLPGEKNDLGKVKFLFPNTFNIYFHDTPYKELFNKDKRAYSHGCIRLSDPAKMARYLLNDQPEWSAEKIDSAMNSGEEKYVKVKEPMPVMITYYTSWVNDQGQLQFVEDIYGHDARLAPKLFSDPVMLSAK